MQTANSVNETRNDSGIDPFAARFLEEEGDPQRAINRLTTELRWTKDEAGAEVRKCLAIEGAKDALRQRGARDGRA